MLPAPPFMHGAGHWVSFGAFTGGNTVVIQRRHGRHGPARHLGERSCASRCNILLIVGDAFGRPLVEHLETNPERYDLSSLLLIASGGAPLNATLKDRFLAVLPSVMIMDAVGASRDGQPDVAHERGRPGRATPAPSPQGRAHAS